MSLASEDKIFVKKVKNDLEGLGHEVWLYDSEIEIGDSLASKIQDGIANCDTLIVFLSLSSVKSSWVKLEWETALTREIDENKKILLPVLIEKCEIPPLLKRKMYADFTKNYFEELLKLAKAVVKPENTDEKEPLDSKPKKQQFFARSAPSLFGQRYRKF